MPVWPCCSSAHTHGWAVVVPAQRRAERACQPRQAPSRGQQWRRRAAPREQQQQQQSLKLDSDRLTKAAVRYAAGLKEGKDEDDLVAKELGKPSAKALKGDPNEKYKDALKAKISQRARELQAEADASNSLFVAGRKMYGKGLYEEATRLFVQAIKEQHGGGDSRLGGDIQLWLGLAYQATGREKDSIALFKEVEKLHPIRSVRKQAANLRFIMEAPKLQRGPDEVVALPVMDSASAVKASRRGAAKRPMRARPRRLSDEDLKALDDRFWESVPLPPVLKTRAAAWAVGILSVVLAIVSVYLVER